MITVVIKDNGEKNVTQYTYENMERELRDIDGAEIVIALDWFDAFDTIKTDFVCFVEADCLVNSGYFASQVGILDKDSSLRKMAVLSSANGILHWGDRIYGYSLTEDFDDVVAPEKVASSTMLYPIQFAYIPGAVMRTRMLRSVIDQYKVDHLKSGKKEDQKIDTDDLVSFSVLLSTMFWNGGSGHRVAVNPNTTYVTTEAYVGQAVEIDFDTTHLKKIFKKAGIL